MMATADRLNARLAAAPHAVQIAFARHMQSNPDDQGRELNILSHYMNKPVDLIADLADSKKSEDAPLWTDQEIIQILTDASKIDQVTDRPLGIWEMMRLEQRDMIRRALVKA